MKMKKGLLMVVFLLAISSVMAAMSFSSAKVTSGMSFTVKNTDQSLLALVPNTNHKASAVSTSTGELVINLDKGYNNGNFGVQNNSEYNWSKIFTVKNNSEEEIEVTVKATRKSGYGTNGASEIAELDSFGKPGQGNPGQGNPNPGQGHISNPLLTITNANTSNVLTFKLKSNVSQDIDLKLLTKSTGLSLKDFDLTVDAKRTDGK